MSYRCVTILLLFLLQGRTTAIATESWDDAEVHEITIPFENGVNVNVQASNFIEGRKENNGIYTIRYPLNLQYSEEMNTLNISFHHPREWHLSKTMISNTDRNILIQVYRPDDEILSIENMRKITIDREDEETVVKMGLSPEITFTKRVIVGKWWRMWRSIYAHPHDAKIVNEKLEITYDRDNMTLSINQTDPKYTLFIDVPNRAIDKSDDFEFIWEAENSGQWFETNLIDFITKKNAYALIGDNHFHIRRYDALMKTKEAEILWPEKSDNLMLTHGKEQVSLVPLDYVEVKDPKFDYDMKVDYRKSAVIPNHRGEFMKFEIIKPHLWIYLNYTKPKPFFY